MMKIIGLMTEDFRFFYEVVESLKRRGEPFVSLGFTDSIPPAVGVIITTEHESGMVQFSKVVADDDPEYAINMALSIIHGGDEFNTLVVGIDPGPRPGMVVLGDGKVLISKIVPVPEQVADELSEIISYVEFQKIIVRIGHGNPINRNRSICALWDLVDHIEVVDETSTTGKGGVPDIEAALAIAKTPGIRLLHRPAISPTSGEIRDIQRRSRLESGGRFTISHELAMRVAKGEITLREALDVQQRSKISHKRESS